MALKSAKGPSPSRETQVKTTRGYHFPLTERTRIQNSENKPQGGCGELGPPAHGCWECERGQPMWGKVWCFLKKLNTELKCDPRIPVLPKWKQTRVHECEARSCSTPADMGNRSRPPARMDEESAARTQTKDCHPQKGTK